MIHRFAWFAAFAILSVRAYGQTGTGYAPVTLRVACGASLDAACGKIVPEIAAQTARAGLDLMPVESAVTGASLVCADRAQAAIAQRDSAASLAEEPGCLGRYDVIGRPLFPYYALLVVRAGSPFHDLSEFAPAAFARRVIAVGPPASGGRVLLQLIGKSNETIARATYVEVGDFEAALQRIADRSVDGFVTMATLASPMIDRARRASDPRGRPLYAFLDVRPADDVLRAGDGNGHCFYRLVGLDFGGPAPVTTVSTDAVMVLARLSRDAHARGGPAAADALTSATDKASAAILADMNSPRDWRPAAASCH